MLGDVLGKVELAAREPAGLHRNAWIGSAAVSVNWNFGIQTKALPACFVFRDAE